MNFNIGDRVRVIGKDPRGLNGRVGKVLALNDKIRVWGDESPMYLTALDGSYSWWIPEEELEREAQPPTEAKEPT